jgi:hypothetical protein
VNDHAAQFYSISVVCMGQNEYESFSGEGGAAFAPETTKTTTKLFQPYLNANNWFCHLIFDNGAKSQRSRAPAHAAIFAMNQISFFRTCTVSMYHFLLTCSPGVYAYL